MTDIFSKTFWAGGVFDGQDVVTPDRMWTPWENVSINIVGIHCVVRPNSQGLLQDSYAFAGNSYSPDIMGWGLVNAKGHLEIKEFYPAGLSFPFPAAGGLTPPHVDLHIAGSPVGIAYQAFYTVFYTKNPT